MRRQLCICHTYGINVLCAFYLQQHLTSKEKALLVIMQGMVKVTCIFARGSMAQGCLVIIVPVGHQSSVVYSERALRQETNAALSQNASQSFNLSLGTYNILIFDVEADGSVDLMRRLYNEIISVSPTCVLPSPTTSQLAPSLLVPGLYVPQYIVNSII